MSDKGIYGQPNGSVAVTIQPYPRAGSQPVIDWLLNEQFWTPVELIQHLKDRADHGRRKHGTYLEAHNGRNAKIDLYQELLDAIFYCAQAIMEGEINYGPKLNLLLHIANGIRLELEV